MDNIKLIIIMEAEFYGLQKIRELSEKAIKNPEEFWKDKIDLISWFKYPDKIREGEPPFEKWFVNGYTNISYNAVDRHIKDKSEKVAFYWINEKLETKSITYRDLFYEVSRAAYVLKELGIKKGDAVSLMMPSIPEAVYMSLAVHRIGATLVIHYLGLSEETLAYRLNDCNSKLIIVANKAFRNGSEIRIKEFLDKLLDSRQTPVEKVLVVKRDNDLTVTKRDIIYDEVKPRGKVYVEPERVESNEPSTIYYTSGTTGRPKGLYHSTAGYVIALNYAFKSLFGIREDDIWWTISELGWPVWPMANLYTIPVMGLTGVLFEGYIGYKPDLFSKIIERFGVTLVWSSTTTLYTLKSLGEETVKSGDTSTLRIILNTGEPLNPGAWKWLRDNLPHVIIGDAYWMTEHLFPVAGTPFGLGEIPFKPGSAGIRFPGSNFKVVDDDGNELSSGKRGYIVIKPISPALAKMHNDPNGERTIKTYWSRFQGYFYTGDYGYYDEDGYLYVLGRADDVIRAGERIGTLEVESVVVTHPTVAEAAAVGYPKETGGEGILVLAVPKKEYPATEDLANDIKTYLRNAGYIVDQVYLVKRLPKTKSGKIMRRLIRAIVRNEDIGDVSTLDDPSILEELKNILSGAKR